MTSVQKVLVIKPLSDGIHFTVDQLNAVGNGFHNCFATIEDTTLVVEVTTELVEEVATQVVEDVAAKVVEEVDAENTDDLVYVDQVKRQVVFWPSAYREEFVKPRVATHLCVSPKFSNVSQKKKSNSF